MGVVCSYGGGLSPLTRHTPRSRGGTVGVPPAGGAATLPAPRG